MTDNHPMLSKFGDCHLCSPYDAAGELLTTTETAISYSGGTTSTAVASYTFTYNSLGEAVSVDNNGSGTSGTTGTPGVPDVRLSSTYDAAGNRTQLSAAIGASHTADFLNSYSYDSLNRPTQVKQSSQSGGDAVDSKLVNFSYNAAGQFKSIDRFNDLTGTPANRISTSSYGYDGLGRLTTLAHSNAKGSGNYAAYTWSYDAGNEATTFTNANYVNEGVSYGYDPTGQLVAASANGGSANASDSLTNTYDATGNATQTTVVGTTANKTVGAGNTLLSDGTYSDTYDPNGNLVEHDSSTDHFTYAYDNRNRLTSVVDKVLASGTWTRAKEIDYTYDIFNNLIGRTVKDYAADGVTVNDTATQRSVYDGSSAVLAFDGNGNLTDRYLCRGSGSDRNNTLSSLQANGTHGNL